MVDGAGTSTSLDYRVQRLEDGMDRLNKVAADLHQIVVRLEERDEKHRAEFIEVKAFQDRLASNKPTMMAVAGVMIPILGAFAYVMSLIVAPIDQRSKVNENNVATIQAKQWTRDDHLRAYEILRSDVAGDIRRLSEWNQRQDDRIRDNNAVTNQLIGRMEK